ncbi:hypothetical protein PHYBLDRAFT_118674 [Phycomyces blakesleeanus NRRL 1555(-)]|uniref:DDE Tnp4 domain-containing protein n=1 Tax=Phycomyces blakesleeanus (strain ATCC 8743b / DSM 1359 / FGSC 10004 / NBRC 33097 / NRRL 1555) TaxID=763407 RepID=A0A167K213_PHYB8|nr:hypothetical protein PHYBLDRAFT_118674 [Phycomyces blakesleeanus NRRL 1555(-)]OAD67097.1 hypothetical protein PHYBLDRAFT_118674 [Phycomyces blakesleeanus NRRL 1555(-)]|eukprot:XP_018285137.1 hypothetical protein PHYBLDRAFT_118674 [Phycomyces blakesleeanus NRRL 1555(-)]
MNDARVFEESTMGSDPNNFFSGDQYVLADASYIPKTYVVPVIKKPKNKELCDADKAFNSYIAMMRIKIEHAFGILKARFCSLKRLPIKIRSRKDMNMVNSWIRVCVVLHNFLIDQTDDMMTMTMKISWEKREKEEIERISREGVTGTVDDYPAMSLSDENAKLKRIRIKEEILIKNGDGSLLKKK